MGIRVCLLGPFAVEVDGREVAVSSRRVRALLAALAVRVGTEVSVTSLIDQVWDSQPPERPRSSLQTLVNRLRSLIGQDVVATRPEGYRLELAPDAVDVFRFERLLASARDESAGPARQAVGDALELWRGEPLVDAGSSLLVEVHGPFLSERYLSALEYRSDLDLRLGRPAGDQVAELRELAVGHPLRESLWLRLITVLRLAGRPAEALESYEELRTRLVDELGADPSAELRQEYRRLLAEREVGDDPGGGGRAVPRQLPPRNPGFVGRERELAALDAAVAGGARVVAVCGPGGVGKTSLAVRWAHRVAGDYGGGQLFVDLAGYGPDEPVGPAVALEVVLRALGVPPGRVPDSCDERSALLRTELAERRVLLVLDNVRDADQVRPLLPGGASLVVLTGRGDLRGLQVRDGAVAWALGELPVDESAALVRRVIGGERAGAEPAAVGDLVELCGGMPLALTIAAYRVARVPTASIAALVADFRQGRRLDVLSDPTDASTDMRAVLSWSYDALEPGAARAMRALALHPGPVFGLSVPAALLGVPLEASRRLLDHLVAAHLVEPDGRNQFRIHDLLREYAIEREAAEPEPDRDAARHRMLDWYLHTLAAMYTTVFGPTTMSLPPPVDGTPPVLRATASEAVERFETYHATLMALLELAAEHRFDGHVWRLACLLGVLQDLRHPPDERRRGAQLAVEAAERAGDDEALARSWHNMGTALDVLGDRAGSITWERRSLAASERAGDLPMAAATMSALALSHMELGQEEDAVHWGQCALRTARRTGSPIRIAQALLNLGHVEQRAGRNDNAARRFREVLAVNERLGSPYVRALALANLAGTAIDGADHDAALDYADRALAVAGDLDDGNAAASALIARGQALAARDDLTAARESWHRALRILDGSGHPDTDRVRHLLATS